MQDNFDQINEYNDNINELGLSSNNLKLMDEELSKSTETLVKDIIDQKDPESIKDLTHLFNMAQTKKAVLRNLTYNQLLDKIEDQMERRLNERVDCFSNRDLLDYMDKIAGTLEKVQKQIDKVDTVPAIQINQQNNVVVNDIDNLSRESRQNIMDAVSSILGKLNLQNNEELNEDPVLNNDDNELEEDTPDDDDGGESFNNIKFNEEEN